MQLHSPEVMAELEKNWQAFKSQQAQLEAKHWGKIAMFHDGELVDVYNNESDAYSIAVEKFELGSFILQHVGERPIDLGFHTMFVQLEE